MAIYRFYRGRQQHIPHILQVPSITMLNAVIVICGNCIPQLLCFYAVLSEFVMEISIYNSHLTLPCSFSIYLICYRFALAFGGSRQDFLVIEHLSSTAISRVVLFLIHLPRVSCVCGFFLSMLFVIPRSVFVLYSLSSSLSFYSRLLFQSISLAQSLR